MKLYYLAYGSNLHPVRISDRVPSARRVGLVKMPYKRVVFTKLSNDKSTKANLIEGNEDDIAWGCVYELDHVDEQELDKAEGLGHGYIKQQAICPVGKDEYNCFLYIASSDALRFDLHPYSWYLDFVVAGAEFQGFPIDYVQELKSVHSTQDPDTERWNNNADVLKRMLEHTASVKPFPREE